jgi:DNA-binding Xre family transcriptional regulator
MTHLRVKELAEARGMNITDLSRKALISYTTAHQLWHGKATQFSIGVLDRVALALEARVSDLFGGDPEPEAGETGNKPTLVLAAA